MYDQLAEIATRMEQHQSGPLLGHLLPRRLSRTRRLALGVRSITSTVIRSAGAVRTPRPASKYPLFGPAAQLAVIPLHPPVGTDER